VSLLHYYRHYQLSLGRMNVCVAKGIANVGNSCYLNATLQMIVHTPLLREALCKSRSSSSQRAGELMQSSLA